MDKATLKIKIDSALNTLRNLFDWRKKYLWLLAIVLFACAIISLTLAALSLKHEPGRQPEGRSGQEETSAVSGWAEGSGQAQVASSAPLMVRKIDGVLVPEGQDDLPVIAVMIENHIASRPPAGLSKANIVYEAEAEGGITRFLAIYSTNEKIDRIGPIRSARPYYIDWAREYGALYVHCGGSPDALAKIWHDGILDLNEFYHAAVFWRDKSRSAPHNVFSSSEKLYGYYIQELKGEKSQYDPWTYKDEEPPENRDNEDKIGIPASKSDYSVEWKYDRTGNLYARWYGSTRHADEDGAPITAKNVVAIFTSKSVVDDEGRLNFKTTGSGKALFCLDGSCREGFWSKPAAKGRTEFTYRDKATVRLNSGATWIEVLPAWADVNLTTTIAD